MSNIDNTTTNTTNINRESWLLQYQCQERLSLDRSHQYLDLDISGRRSGGGGDSRFTGVSDRVSPMYPALSNIPPYSSPPVGHPPQFSNVTRRGGFGRRDSYMSDTDDPAALMGNLKLQPH